MPSLSTSRPIRQLSPKPLPCLSVLWRSCNFECGFNLFDVVGDPGGEGACQDYIDSGTLTCEAGEASLAEGQYQGL